MHERSAREALDFARDKLSELIARTLYPNYTLCLIANQRVARMGWIQSHPPGLVAQPRIGLPLKTAFGPFHLLIQMRCEAEVIDGEEGGCRLRVGEYAYKLSSDPAFDSPSQFVWTNQQGPFQHMRFESRLHMGAKTLHLDQVRLPTGIVPLHAIIRFIISDLGAKPRCGEGPLEAVLRDSYDELTRTVDLGPALMTHAESVR